MKIASALVIAMLAGCAAPEPQTWYRVGASQRDFDIALARCRMEQAKLQEPERLTARDAGATMSQAGRDLQFAATQLQFMNDCLTAEGFYRR